MFKVFLKEIGIEKIDIQLPERRKRSPFRWKSSVNCCIVNIPMEDSGIRRD